MNEENTGVEEVHVADEPGIEEAQIATESQQGVEEPRDASEDRHDEQKDNWKAARQTMKEQADQLRQLRNELAAYASPKDQNGPEEDDIPTYGELKKIISKQEKNFQERLEELQVKAKYPDMESVIEKYGKSLPDSVKRGIMNASNSHLAAYEACITSVGYYKDALNSSPHENARRASQNASKPGNASSVGGTGTLSKAKYFESLSDADLIDLSNKAISGKR